mgnify:CR=1 FL=1|jgi:hypothetical protein
MNRLFSALLLSAFLFSSMPSYGHGDHNPLPPISEAAVLEQSKKDLAIIVDNKEKVGEELLDTSWKESKDPAFHDKGEGYYVVAFKHPKEDKTVYLLMANTGQFYDVNFTGKFSGLAK